MARLVAGAWWTISWNGLETRPMLLVDDREPDAIQNALRSVYPDLGVTRLECGDLVAPLPAGIVVIERKTPSDLLGSISDGRLFEQVERMATLADYPAIVLHGSLLYDARDYATVDGRVTEFPGKAVRNALLAVMWSGVPVVYKRTDGYVSGVGEVLGSAAKGKERRARPKRVVTFPPLDPAVECLSLLPMGKSGDNRTLTLGPSRAESLLRYVGKGTIGRLADAIEWLSGMGWVNTEHPAGWGKTTWLNARHLGLGLMSHEYLTVVGGQTQDGGNYMEDTNDG